MDRVVVGVKVPGWGNGNAIRGVADLRNSTVFVYLFKGGAMGGRTSEGEINDSDRGNKRIVEIDRKRGA